MINAIDAGYDIRIFPRHLRRMSDIRLVNKFLLPVIEEYGYERLKPKRTKFFPLRGESLGTYIKNRVLLSTF